MLKFGNKEFRNLQEQVAKNMRDIQNIMQGTTVLAEFGIKVIGQVDTAMELPDPATYEGEFGDAYIVGTEEPYEYYIFTRAFEGQDEPSWFDLGIFPVPGPQGPQGIQGPAGPQGQTGATGQDGTSAGFGTVSATATTLPAGSDATVSVVASGPNTEKSFAFAFGIPEGEQGASAECEWGAITGDLSDQTDLVSALQAKQNSLVSGTNIKTINNESILGSGNLTIAGGVSDVEVNGTSVVTAGVAEITIPTNYVTTDTAQTISGNKTLTGSTSFGGGGAISISGTGINVYTPAAIRTYGADLNLGGPLVLGSSKIKSASNDSYGLVIPTTTSFTADKTIATTDQIPSVSYPVTDVEVDGVSVLSGTVAEITMPDLSDYVTSTDLSTELADYTPTANLASVATSGDYDDLLNKPTIPAAVSGTNDGTNWTSITIGADTKNIPTGSNEFQKAIGISPYNHNAYIVFDADINASTPVIGYKGDIDTHTNTLYIKNTYNWSHDATIKIETADGLYGSENEQGIYFTTNSGNSAHYAMIPHTGSWTANKYLATTDQLFSGNYNDLSNKPTIPTATSDLTNDSGFITSSALSGYATETWVTNQGYSTFSGDYDDLLDKPDLSVYAESADLATVATTGDYDDLLNKPTIPTNTSDLNNDSGFITSSALSGYATETWVGQQGYLTSVSWNDISSKPTFATVATSGDYDDLLNKPSIPTVSGTNDGTNWTSITINNDTYNIPSGGISTVDWSDIQNKPTFATVATSGDYDDLLNKPTIPAAQVNSDWNAASGVAQILNKPTLATVATSGSYNDLTDKPTIPTVPVQDVTVGGTSVVSSGTAVIPAILGSSTETWTFTLSDDTTVTKTVVLG